MRMTVGQLRQVIRETIQEEVRRTQLVEKKSSLWGKLKGSVKKGGIPREFLAAFSGEEAETQPGQYIIMMYDLPANSFAASKLKEVDRLIMQADDARSAGVEFSGYFNEYILKKLWNRGALAQAEEAHESGDADNMDVTAVGRDLADDETGEEFADLVDELWLPQFKKNYGRSGAEGEKKYFKARDDRDEAIYGNKHTQKHIDDEDAARSGWERDQVKERVPTRQK